MPTAAGTNLSQNPPPVLDDARDALYLDFDGTLVDFAPTPDAVALRPGTIALLEKLNRKLEGALAIVSGRQIANLDRFLAPLELTTSGIHGREMRRPAGGWSGLPLPRALDEARRRLAALVGPAEPLLVEDKGAALVLHFRQHPEAAPRAETLARDAALGLDSLRVVGGHGIFEILERGVTKASAVENLAASPPFQGRRPVYVGDDATDEDAIQAAQALGGIGVKVGPGATVAAFRLPDVDAVHRWLAAFVRPPSGGTASDDDR